MAVTAAYRSDWPGPRIIRGSHDGRPKRWTVVVEYEAPDGKYKRTYQPKADCQLRDLADIIDTHLRLEDEVAGGIRVIGWTAMSR